MLRQFHEEHTHDERLVVVVSHILELEDRRSPQELCERDGPTRVQQSSLPPNRIESIRVRSAALMSPVICSSYPELIRDGVNLVGQLGQGRERGRLVPGCPRAVNFATS